MNIDNVISKAKFIMSIKKFVDFGFDSSTIKIVDGMSKENIMNFAIGFSDVLFAGCDLFEDKGVGNRFMFKINYFDEIEERASKDARIETLRIAALSDYNKQKSGVVVEFNDNFLEIFNFLFVIHSLFSEISKGYKSNKQNSIKEVKKNIEETKECEEKEKPSNILKTKQELILETLEKLRNG